MSGKWCTWCKLSPSEWQHAGHNCGEKWTIDGMSQLRDKIMRKEIEAKASNKKGVVEVPLIDTIPIDHTIFSLLHAEIGVGNKILDSFLEWVDYEVENLSEEEITARNDHLKAIDDHKDKVETHTQWLNVNSTDLADLRSERMEINVWMKEKGLTVDEKKSGLMESKRLSSSINMLVKGRNEIEAVVTTYNKVVQKLKKIADSLKSKRGPNSPVRLDLENCLVEFLIIRAKYHGGNLEGKTVSKFFQDAIEIFETMKPYLVLSPNKACDESEIDDMIKRYVEICTLFDGLFSVARTKSGEADDTICDKAQKYVSAIMVKWRDLGLSMDMLKIHGLEDHLVPQMRLFKGIGCFIEDFIEQAHQFGMKEEKRTANMRDRKKAANSHSAWEHASHHAEVIAVKKESSARSKRKLMKSSAEEKNVRNKIDREETRKYCLENATLISNPIDDYKKKKRQVNN